MTADSRSKEQQFWDFMDGVRGYHSPDMARDEWNRRVSVESGGRITAKHEDGKWVYASLLEHDEIEQIMIRVARGFARDLADEGDRFLEGARDCVYDDNDVCVRHMYRFKCYYHRVKEVVADLRIQSGERLN